MSSARSDMYELFLKDVLRDMTQKAGQKCTAIRRVLVPREILAAVRDDLAERLGAVKVGDPAGRGNAHGPARHRSAARRMCAGIAKLAAEGEQTRRKSGQDFREGVFRFAGTLRNSQRRQGRARARSVRSGRLAPALLATTPRRSSRAATAGWCARCTRRTRPAWSRRSMGVAPYHGRIFLGHPKIETLARARARCCRSWCTAARGAPAAARSWAGGAASRSTCSASRWKARGR